MTVSSSTVQDGPDGLFSTVTYLIAVPSPPSSLSGSSSPSLFAMQVLQMQDSYQVWVGLATEAMCQEWQMSKNKDATQASPQRIGGDEEEDEELKAALKAAGRDVPQSTTIEASGKRSASRVPAGSLATEWAVAMVQPGPASSAAPSVRGSSLFRTTADLSLPMAQRIGEIDSEHMASESMTISTSSLRNSSETQRKADLSFA